MSAGDNPMLRLLQEHYGDRWRLRRTEGLWFAVAARMPGEACPMKNCPSNQ